MYMALDKRSNELVAIKRMRLFERDDSLMKEPELLKSCISRYIVRYYDALMKYNELWVRNALTD